MNTLAPLTNPTVMTALFQRHIPLLRGEGISITHCDIRHVKYVPKKHGENTTLAACYHLGVKNRASHHVHTLILYCKAYHSGRSRPPVDESCPPARGVHAHRGGPVHIPDRALTVWTFPSDPMLPHLAIVSSPDHVLSHLPYQALPDGLDRPENVQSVTTEVINYRPEERCLTRFDLLWGSPTPRQRLTLFGKTYRGHDGPAILSRWEQLWSQFREAGQEIIIPQPLGYAPAIRTLWQFGVDGRPLCEALDERHVGRYMKSVAKGLATLHQSALIDLPRRTIDDHVLEVRKKVAKLRRGIPALAGTLDHMADRIERTRPNSSDIPYRPMHWDFHIYQLLAHGGSVAFLDFDELALGDPLQDLANFIVDLHFRAISPFLVQRIIRSLLDSYRTLVAWDVSVERINWHMAIQFVNKASRCFTQQWPDVGEAVDGILRLAEQDIVLR